MKRLNSSGKNWQAQPALTPEQRGVIKMTEILLTVSASELCLTESITEEMILAAVESGVAEPVEGEDLVNWVFDSTSVHWLKKAIRLHQDLEIDWVAVAMVIDLLQQKESLQRENQYIRQQLKRFL